MNRTISSSIIICLMVILVAVTYEDTGKINKQQDLGYKVKPGCYSFDVLDTSGTAVVNIACKFDDIVIFDDYASDSTTSHKSDGNKLYLEPGNAAFIRSRENGVTSMVYLYNYSNESALLVVNGVARNSWDRDNGYREIDGGSPVFNSDSLWRWGTNR